ncbi:MAG: exosortase [Oscillatoriales cyanobacterium]|nr:MAG: exosortase [Oscillatoriales cyanobacterium]
MQIQRRIRILLKRYLMGEGITVLLVLLYAPLLVHWYDGWFNKNISIEHEYFSHGIIALMLAGICLSLKGFPGLKLQAMPLLFVFLASPNHIPYLIEPYALPLQDFIAKTSGWILIKVGLNVRVEEIYLYVNDRIVEVAPHCAGLKMLFTSLYVSLILLDWTGVGNSHKRSIFFLVAASIISITSNILRNTLLTYFHGTDRETFFTWLHAGWGGDLYSACILGLLVLLINGMEKYFPSQSAH